MTAYATASGYSQSSTASKTCTYTLLEMPSFTFEGTMNEGRGSYTLLVSTNIKPSSGMPSGVRYWLEFIYQDTVAYGMDIPSGYKSYSLNTYSLNWSKRPQGGQIWTMKVTATCDGYEPLSKSISAYIGSWD